MKIASGKKWIMAVIALLMVCVCAAASAQSYSLGDEADEIETIQTALTKLKLYSGAITGHYGEKTEAAVKAFQKRYALTDDGIAGEDTIKDLYKAAGITYTGTSSSSSSSSNSSNNSDTLRHGSRSEAVRQMQENLKKLGYYTGNITGNFGTLTEAAVMKFQRANNLSADGVAGAKTLAKIAEKAGSSSGTSSSGSSSSSSSSSSSLRYGTQSEAVRQLQQNLKTLGYYTGSVTGNFGNLTKEAVYNFQRANNLSADGVAGAKTLAKIASEMSGSTGSSSSSSSSGSSSSSSSSSSSAILDTSATLMKNSSGDEVLKLQKMLASLGFYSGNQTGNFGDKTREAVVAFQQKMGLTADGVAGKRTLAAINAQYKKGSSSSGSSSSSSASGSNVLYENFYNWRRDYANGEYCSVYDPATGYTWTLRVMTKDAHMDAEPATAEDTAIMNKAFGGNVTWTPKPVWVTFSDGKTFIGSTHNVPHTPYHLKNNNFDGHLCVHFPISMEKAKEIGPYATSHQETINEAWEKHLAKFR